MVSMIITLVNNALETVGEVPVQASDFTSGYQAHHMLLRQEVPKILRKMHEKKRDIKLKKTFTISTVASQATYTISFNAAYMQDAELRLLSTEADYFLNYLTEQEALYKYVDFANLTIEGRPLEFWFQTTSTAGNILLRLNPVPDKVYTIEGLQYVPYTALGATDSTTFEDEGDLVVQSYLAAKLANELQKTNTADLMSDYGEAWHKWLGLNTRQNDFNRLVRPYQQ